MNEEKDRFGDFIWLLERAREDVYFAEKDRELLDKQKRRLEKAPTRPAETSCQELSAMRHCARQFESHELRGQPMFWVRWDMG